MKQKERSRKKEAERKKQKERSRKESKQRRLKTKKEATIGTKRHENICLHILLSIESSCISRRQSRMLGVDKNKREEVLIIYSITTIFLQLKYWGKKRKYLSSYTSIN